MTIEIRHLRYAEAADRHGSFRKAADSLALKQSNLSRRIRHLEEHLGVSLFERTNSGVRTTAAGRDFLVGVRRILDELQTVVDSAKAAGRGEAGRIAVGFYTSLSVGNLRATLIEFARRFPDVEISTIEGSRARLCSGVQNGTIDVAIVTGETLPDCGQSMALWSERLFVALPEDHPLAANEIIHWTDLRHERFLLSERDPGPEIQDILVSRLASPGVVPHIVRQDVSTENIKSLVGTGRGVSLMSEACLGASSLGVVYREARDGNGATRIGYCAFWKDSNSNAALLNFIRLLEERSPPPANESAARAAALRSRDPSP